MARPVKNGLDYFPLDVGIFDDELIEGISGEFGIKGELAVVKLLCAVYKKGYFVVWNDLMQAKIAKQIQGSKDLANQIVARLVEWGFFDKNLFDSAKVLTSVNIQNRYFEATKRRKLQKPSRYVINVSINEEATGINVDINTQSKSNKTKLNKNNDDDDAREPSINFDEPKNTNSRESFELWEQLWGFPNAIAIPAIDEWIATMGDDMLKLAIEYAGSRNVQAKGALKYVTKIIDGWKQRNIGTVAEAEQASREHEQRMSNARGGQGRPNNVRETLPDWAKDDYNPAPAEPVAEPELTPELAAEMQKIREFASRKETENQSDD